MVGTKYNPRGFKDWVEASLKIYEELQSVYFSLNSQSASDLQGVLNAGAIATYGSEFKINDNTSKLGFTENGFGIRKTSAEIGFYAFGNQNNFDGTNVVARIAPDRNTTDSYFEVKHEDVNNSVYTRLQVDKTGLNVLLVDDSGYVKFTASDPWGDQTNAINLDLNGVKFTWDDGFTNSRQVSLTGTGMGVDSLMTIADYESFSDDRTFMPKKYIDDSVGSHGLQAVLDVGSNIVTTSSTVAITSSTGVYGGFISLLNNSSSIGYYQDASTFVQLTSSATGINIDTGTTSPAVGFIASTNVYNKLDTFNVLTPPFLANTTYVPWGIIKKQCDILYPSDFIGDVDTSVDLASSYREGQYGFDTANSRQVVYVNGGIWTNASGTPV